MADEGRLKQLSGFGEHVATEAEKDVRKRRWSPTTSQVCDLDEVDSDPDAPLGEDDMDEDSGGGDMADELPDLGLFFSHFDISDDAVISMCRAYASYLASKQPKKLMKK